MIIRILGEGQFRVPESSSDGLQELDGKLEAAVESGDDGAFRTALVDLLAHVREVGELIPEGELDASDAILPGEDAHVEDVRALLADDGVIPG